MIIGQTKKKQIWQHLRKKIMHLINLLCLKMIFGQPKWKKQIWQPKRKEKLVWMIIDYVCAYQTMFYSNLVFC